jgi:hypothetical protein
LAKWGKKLLARKGVVTLAVCAIARKLTVAIWYLMMGRWSELEEIDKRLTIKVGQIISQLGTVGLEKLRKTRKALREEVFQSLKTGKVYVLDPNIMYTPKPKLEVP